MEDIYKYKTIAAAAQAEFKDRGSKFIAYAYPVRTVQDVKEKLQLLKKEHPKAVHHCLAWRMGTDGTQFRASDDGEPAGSAGKPMLGQIDSAGLTNVLVVVVRYFGGTLLGVPGLINAYKTVAAEALSAAPKAEKSIEEKIEVQFDYAAINDVMQLLKQCDATIYRQELQLFCLVQAGLPRKSATDYIQRLTDLRGVEVTRVKE